MNVFDFDNTIYDGESFIDCFKRFLRRDPSLLKFVPMMLTGIVRYKRGIIDLQQSFEKYSCYLEEYLHRFPDVEGEIKAFWDDNMHRIKPLYRQLQQPDDIVVSASPEMMISEICGRLGIEHFVASRFDPKTFHIERMCFRDEKVKMFRERYPQAHIDSFFTDSVNDKPMMELADKVFMVKGDRIKRIK